MQASPLQLPAVRHLFDFDFHPTQYHGRIQDFEGSPNIISPINPDATYVPRHRPLRRIYFKSILPNAKANQHLNGPFSIKSLFHLFADDTTTVFTGDDRRGVLGVVLQEEKKIVRGPVRSCDRIPEQNHHQKQTSHETNLRRTRHQRLLISTPFFLIFWRVHFHN